MYSFRTWQDCSSSHTNSRLVIRLQIRLPQRCLTLGTTVLHKILLVGVVGGSLLQECQWLLIVLHASGDSVAWSDLLPASFGNLQLSFSRLQRLSNCEKGSKEHSPCRRKLWLLLTSTTHHFRHALVLVSEVANPLFKVLVT